MPNDDPEDRQAGPADSVHYEDRLTDTAARPGPLAGPSAPSGGTNLDRPRLKRTAELVTTDAGDIYILRPTDDSDLRIERPDAVARSLLAALDGTRTALELEHEFGSERARDTLAQLSELGLLDDAADDARVSAREAARYDRQLRYFSEVSSGVLPPSEYQRRLREARVLILGVGGLGTWAS